MTDRSHMPMHEHNEPSFSSFTCLLSPHVPQDDDKNFRRAPSWRKKFRPKDMRGVSLGVSDTLPANFRVTSSAASPSTQPKRSPMDGKQRLCVVLCGTCAVDAATDLPPCSQFFLNGLTALFTDAVTNGMSLHVILLPWKHRKSVYTEAGHCHSQDLLLLTHNGKMVHVGAEHAHWLSAALSL